MRSFGEKIEGVDYLLRPGSYGVLVENGRAGVIRSNRLGKYFLVGGGLDAGESERDALRREAREEIGFEIEITGKIGAAVEYFFAEIDRRYVAKQCHFYRISLLDKIEGAENELLWIAETALSAMYHRSHRWIIRRELKL